MLKLICFAIACLLIAVCAAAQSIPDTEPISAENTANVALLETMGRGVIHEFVWSPDSAQLAVATSIGLYLHDANALEAEPLYVEVASGARSVACSPDGTRIATGSENGTVTFWDATSHEMIFRVQEHLYRINA